MAPVTVSPQSQTDASSYAGGGIGPQQFILGGNPNLALLTSPGSISPLVWIAVAAVAAFLFLRRR
jgi:hypothetical protein